MDDWRIAVELAFRLGADVDLATVNEVTDELARVAPAFNGVDTALLRKVRDGAVLPLREHRDELVVRSTRDLSILADDGSGVSWDPIKVEGDDAQPAEVVEERAVPADAPAVHTWPQATPSYEAPARDAYALRLVAPRALYDRGRITSETSLLRELARPATMRLNPSDAARFGVETGDDVRVTCARGTFTVAVEPDPGVPAGVARYDFTADGEGPAAMIDAGSPVTDLRVESIR